MDDRDAGPVSQSSTPGPAGAALNFVRRLPILWQRDYLNTKLCNMTEVCLHG